MKTEKKSVEKYPLGIDIGTGSIKMVQLASTHKGYNIERTAQATIPISISKDKEKLDLFVIDTIKKLFSSGKFKKAKVSLSFPASDVCVRTFTIPSVSEKERDSLPEAVKWASKRYITQSLEEMVLAYSFGEEVEENKVKKMTIVLAAVHKSIFKRYVELIQRAGLEVAVATVSCFALKNIISEDESAKNKALTLTDIGYESTDITIFNNNFLVFTRNIPEGNKALDEALRVLFKLSDKKVDLKPEQILEFKRKFGIVLEDRNETFCGLKTSEVTTAVTEHSDRIIRELQLSISHYRQLSHGSRIEEIILSGGGSGLKNLEKVISDKINILATVMQPPASLSMKNTGDFNTFAIAIGSALEAGSNPNLINNIEKISQEKSLRVKKLIIKTVITVSLAVVGAISILGGIYWYQGSRLKYFKGELNKLQVESKTIKTLRDAMARLSLRKGLLEKFSFPEDSLLKTFVQLDGILNHRNIFVRKIEFTKNVNGKNILLLNAEVARVNKKDPMESLNEFLADLEAIDVFMRMRPKINKDYRNERGGDTLRFDIECIFKESR
ncbi:MAG: type IV pilus assembly protein PilM [Omnitrophica bacterium]|nr:type IV pilus assembly protein PilM [Candidatus Omnitrophota bacterium]